MALINCPECGKEISDKAKSCPHCGFSLKVTHESNIVKVGAIINIIGALGFWVMYFIMEVMSSMDRNAETTKSSSSDVNISVTYESNTSGLQQAWVILYVLGIVVPILSIGILKIHNKMVQVIFSSIMFIGAIVAVLFMINGLEGLLLCCGSWVALAAPVIYITGSLICLIGSFINNGK